ncbi:Hpt domain-containing protein [Arthrobacter ramosus]|uniref:Hpt domain-containing protein n=1 Tax=Arthrobacter ramosus TaxID=1672 RepID=UPI001F3FD21E|nr:Hpt domain-containing protein [Arthrobacter ramosus]
MFSPGSSRASEDADDTGPADDPDPPAAGRPAEYPILDLAEFQFLEDQLDNPLIARIFAGDFAKLWWTRYGILAGAVGRGDVPGALDAILSLRTSSTMVGGVRLALLAARLEERIRYGDLPAAQPLLEAIADCGQRTVQELRDSYVLRND